MKSGARVGLSQEHIVEAAYAMLREHGLSALSMRRLAHNLEVQAGALYYHVANKQELLVALAERILTDPVAAATTDPRQAACNIRAALLAVRDGAETVSFAYAFRPARLLPLAGLEHLFTEQFPPRRAYWAARTLIHYVLGFVASEQNHTELVRAKVISGGPQCTDEPAEAFFFGVEAVIQGLATLASVTPQKADSDRQL